MLAKRLLVLYLVYFLIRLVFLAFNYSYFSFNSFGGLAFTFLLGLRFDTAGIVLSNSLFILLSVLPFPAFFTRGYQRMLKVIYMVTNAFFILMNCADFSFFRFIHKRTAADVFDLFGLGSDMSNTLPRLFADFWYLLVLCALFLVVANRLFNRYAGPRHLPQRPVPDGSRPRPPLTRTAATWAGKTLLMLLVLGACFVAARGGVQLKPLRIIAASEHTYPSNAPLVLNTTFSILNTLGKQTLEPVQYMPPPEAARVLKTLKQPRDTVPFTARNVIVIILESFSREYMGFFNDYPGYTPFLDSLAGQSLACTNAYACTRISIEGIPAVTASLPALMEEPFITSLYNGNRINSLASVLKQDGYHCGFFHGGNNGTMGFDVFARAAGFDTYAGRNEYGPGDYDGHWGVFDHAFYRYFIAEINRMPRPFFNTIFSLSSHHPYTVPDSLAGRFAPGDMPIHRAIRYGDYALRLFFDEARRQPWFDSTLFVITADHSGPNAVPAYQTNQGIYRIPILYYQHGVIPPGRNSTVTQQTDIMPTVLHLLHNKRPFVAFGQDLFDTAAPHVAVNYFNGVYQLINDSLVVEFDGNALTGVFDYCRDPMLQDNRAGTDEGKYGVPMRELMSYIQQFNVRMLNNHLVP